MATIVYLKEISLLKKNLVLFFIGYGIFSVFTISFFSGIFNIAIGITLIAREGSEINLENNTYQTVKSIFGINFGKWKPCPKFEYVSVFKTKEGIEVSSYGSTIRN